MSGYNTGRNKVDGFDWISMEIRQAGSVIITLTCAYCKDKTEARTCCMGRVSGKIEVYKALHKGCPVMSLAPG